MSWIFFGLGCLVVGDWVGGFFVCGFGSLVVFFSPDGWICFYTCEVLGCRRGVVLGYGGSDCCCA